MLTVSAKTSGEPLVMANIMISAKEDEPTITSQQHKDYISGVVQGRNFAFTTKPGAVYNGDVFVTDALALTWDNEKTFAAIVTSLKRDGKLLIASDLPLTCEISGKSIKYFHTEQADVTIGVESKPASVKLNGTEVTGWTYNESSIIIKLPEGEGNLMID
jgi:hypothetical protein